MELEREIVESILRVEREFYNRASLDNMSESRMVDSILSLFSFSFIFYFSIIRT